MRDGDEPRARVVGDALVRPLRRGGDERLLHGVLALLELPVPAHERAEHAGRDLAEQRVDRGRYPASHLGWRFAERRTSTTPDHFTMRPTISRRRSSVSTSTIQKPISDSFDSAYGPSVTATGPPSA